MMTSESANKLSLRKSSSYHPDVVQPVVLERILMTKQKQSNELDLSNCELHSIPNEVFELTSLKTLNLSNNNIKVVPSKIAHLTTLEQLDLSENYLNDLPFTIGNMKQLNVMKVNGNPLISLPKKLHKPEDCKQILNHFKEMQNSVSSWGDVKLIFLGDNNAGKTSLMWSLINRKKKKLFSLGRRCSMVCVHTDQIEMVPYSNKAFTFQIWDFAGKEVYYDMCDMFLSNNTFYVITFNMSTHHHDHELQYWVDLVQHKTNCPTAIVGTHMENITKQEFQKIEEDVKRRFPTFPFFAVNNKNYKGVKELGSFLKSAAQPILKKTVPSTFLAVKDWILNTKLNGHKFMSYRDFQDLIEGVNCNILDCLNYLNDCGSICFVQDVILDKSFLILDPAFVVEAWLLFISSKQITTDGAISVADLFTIWESLPADTHSYLLQTLLHYNKAEFTDNQLLMVSSSIKRNSHGHI